MILFNLYSKTIMRELEDQLAFITGGHNFNIDRLQCVVNKTERTLRQISKRKQEVRTINCKKIECNGCHQKKQWKVRAIHLGLQN